VNEGKDDNKVGKRSGTKEGGKAGREMQGRREELMWEEREGEGSAKTWRGPRMKGIYKCKEGTVTFKARKARQ
jgi:hypothetical protein